MSKSNSNSFGEPEDAPFLPVRWRRYLEMGRPGLSTRYW